jgi:dUTP pyrophosphatase
LSYFYISKHSVCTSETACWVLLYINSLVMLKYKKNADAIAPKLATPGSAGYDLYTPVDFVIKANDKYIVNTGLAFEIPPTFYIQIKDRSSMASKYQIITAGGVIDNDYRGPVCVILFNCGKKSRSFKRGDRIAQFIIQKYYNMPLKNCDTLSSTERNESGFGSTGA